MRGIINAAHLRQPVKTEQAHHTIRERRRHRCAPNLGWQCEVEFVWPAAQATALPTCGVQSISPFQNETTPERKRESAKL